VVAAAVSETAVDVAVVSIAEVGLLGRHGAALATGRSAAPRTAQREVKRILDINESNGRGVDE
jgi:hypothetical protein